MDPNLVLVNQFLRRWAHSEKHNSSFQLSCILLCTQPSLHACAC